MLQLFDNRERIPSNFYYIAKLCLKNGRIIHIAINPDPKGTKNVYHIKENMWIGDYHIVKIYTENVPFKYDVYNKSIKVDLDDFLHWKSTQDTQYLNRV